MAPTGVWNPHSFSVMGSGIIHHYSGYIGSGVFTFGQPNVIVQTPEEIRAEKLARFMLVKHEYEQLRQELAEEILPDEGFELRGKL